jgi:hypothetical protein
MKIGIFKAAAFAASLALRASDTECPAEDGHNYDDGGDLASDMFKYFAPSRLVAELAWGEHTMWRNIQRQTTFIRRTATEAERRIAEQNAAAYYARLSQAQKSELKKKKRYWAVPVTKSKPPSKPAKPPSKPEPAKPEDIMIYDPLGGSVVNKYVYTLKDVPSPDTPMSLGGYEPLLYVGR